MPAGTSADDFDLADEFAEIEAAFGFGEIEPELRDGNGGCDRFEIHGGMVHCRIFS